MGPHSRSREAAGVAEVTLLWSNDSHTSTRSNLMERVTSLYRQGACVR
jgi:hypothetical protein